MARKRRGLSEINAGSMADIAFLLLIFFLVTTTMDKDFGMDDTLSPPPKDEEKVPEYHKKNTFVVLLNKSNKILSGVGSATNHIQLNGAGQLPSSFKDDVKKFLDNRGNVDNVSDEYKGIYKKNPRSDANSSDNPEKAIIWFQLDPNSSYNVFIQVRNELEKAYNELRNEKSNIDYGKDFNNLDKNSKELGAIMKYYPKKISKRKYY